MYVVFLLATLINNNKTRRLKFLLFLLILQIDGRPVEFGLEIVHICRK